MARQTCVLLLPSPVSSGSVGTVAKALGVARSLRKRGCQVRFAIGGELATLIAQHGFAVSPCPVPRPARSLRPMVNMVEVLEWTGLAEPDFISATIEAELAVIREFRPDVIFAETRPSAAISAAIAQIPLVTVASWPMHPNFPANRDCRKQPVQAFNQQLSQYRLPEVEHVTELLFQRSDLKLSPSLPELEPELEAAADVTFVGYMLDATYDEQQLPTWYRTWQKKNLIFIYLSVSAISPELYRKTIPETFAGLPYEVICACGFHYDLKQFPEASENVRFVRFIPAQAVIEEASLVIFHGGQDTMLMTLLHGLPSIVFPGQHFERQYNTQQLVHHGAARSLPTHAFRSRRLRQVVKEFNETVSYRTASQRLSHNLARYGGTEQAVEQILSFV